MIPIYMTADGGKDVLSQGLVDKFKIPTIVSPFMGFPYFFIHDLFDNYIICWTKKEKQITPVNLAKASLN